MQLVYRVYVIGIPIFEHYIFKLIYINYKKNHDYYLFSLKLCNEPSIPAVPISVSHEFHCHYYYDLQITLFF